MKTLYEELTQIDHQYFSGIRLEIANLLDKAEIIKIDNIAHYFFEDNSQDEWDLLSDFPNIAPVFENFYMEYTIPEFINTNAIKGGKNLWFGRRIGILICAKENDWDTDIEQGRWGLNLFFFVKDNNDPVTLWPLMAIIVVNEYGKPIWIDKNANSAIRYMNLFSVNSSELQIYARAAHMMLNPALLAISFMHCKNVERIEYNPHVITQKRKRHSCRVKHYTLQIDPMRKIIETEGGSKENGLKKALHICRGHFKDFSEGKGLFGKYKGTYWWADHSRGSLQNGIINKDYEVTGPK